MTHSIVYPDAPEGGVDELDEHRLARLEQLGTFTMHAGKPRTNDEFVTRLKGAQGVLLGWGMPEAVLQRVPSLEVISFTGIGVGTFVNLECAVANGISVCNTPGYADTTVGEHTMALLLALTRHIPMLDRQTKAGQWNHDMPAVQLAGRTLGLVGFGGIAAAVSRMAMGFGMEVVAWTRNPSNYQNSAPGVNFLPLADVLTRADVVSVHVALSEETEGLIDARRLASLKPTALLINTARGQVVDEAALAECLAERRIAGAALDVYGQEPLPQNHPWAALDNVIVTPHVAYNSPEAQARIYDIAIDNLVGYFRGEPTNVVAEP
ncbi:MAG: hypothetical protein HOI95_23025 [Chromatiales bacterium]|jgi:phosphoglycerate dehydrogenase-like enzyme|nr:hypothetical protein [Chromatiales bacterium]